MSTKRNHISTGDTPGKPHAKQPAQANNKISTRRTLFSDDHASKKISVWTNEETSALVQYITLYWEEAHTDRWPAMKQIMFWEKWTEAVNKVCKSTRTGTFAHFQFVCKLFYNNHTIIFCYI